MPISSCLANQKKSVTTLFNQPLKLGGWGGMRREVFQIWNPRDPRSFMWSSQCNFKLCFVSSKSCGPIRNVPSCIYTHFLGYFNPFVITVDTHPFLCVLWCLFPQCVLPGFSMFVLVIIIVTVTDHYEWIGPCWVTAPGNTQYNSSSNSALPKSTKPTNKRKQKVQ